ncbi:YopX family protein [Carnobacterium maltaromaticum]|uniref:YopX family protein n=1 Tax=Carnobacterium maltaromaticum TaxID=2751 RepID=A0AAW9K152_CARML|nr:YopX family protein [Carnobacterium maltaromaticum]MDZ5758084.1 YopX family protein [Carnobacterium maltaromaticum]
MRETKFRGKSVETGEWVYGSLVQEDGKAWIVGGISIEDAGGVFDFYATEWYEVIPETVGQYTGLKDQNVVEIYDGDIDKEDNGELSVIVYLKKSGSYCVMPLDIYLNEDYQNKKYFPELLYNFGYDLTFDNVIPEKYLSIVGNIYDNPELLEVEK